MEITKTTKSSKYIAKEIAPDGSIAWSDSEHDIWHRLYVRQIELIRDKACDEYLQGLAQLQLPHNHIPQLSDIDRVLMATTGWKTAPVPCLINFDKFFGLLANKQFPVATFIRNEEEFDYLQEPDIFHEIFGHCPLLTNPAFAHFTHIYGKLGLYASKEDRVFLARLYWFTVEFGLVESAQGHKIFGGGILSSPGETEYAYFDNTPKREPFDIMEVLRTPYRIDILQPIYYVLSKIDDLFEVSQMDLMSLIEQAKTQGLKAPLYTS